MGDNEDVANHEANDLPDPGHVRIADANSNVLPLHPPGTFARNTQSGDIINGMAKTLGVSPPDNVTKLPRK